MYLKKRVWSTEISGCTKIYFLQLLCLTRIESEFAFYLISNYKKKLNVVISILDFDECESLDSNDCHVNAMCTNTEGSYVCRCKRGYEADGRFCIGNYNYFVISWFICSVIAVL